MPTDALGELARFQHGVVTRGQALASGLSPRQVGWRLTSGRWVRVYPGVYLTQPGRSDLLSATSAAVLHAGPGARLSHWSAAYDLGLVRDRPRQVHVTVPEDRRVRAPDGVVIHRSDRPSASTDVRHWPPHTTVEETVLDVAAISSADQAVAIAALACQRGLTWYERLRVELERRPRHRWRVLLTAALDDIGQGAQSTLEVRYVRDVARPHGLPAGRPQTATRAGVHDIGYDEERVLIELDGLAYHGAPEARASDARRDRRSAGDGWLTLRALWVDVALRGCELAVDVGAVLNRRGWRGRLRPCRRRDCAVRRTPG